MYDSTDVSENHGQNEGRADKIGWAGITHPDDVEEERAQFKKSIGEIKQFFDGEKGNKTGRLIVWQYNRTTR